MFFDSIYSDLATHMQSAEFLLQARHPAYPKAFTRQRRAAAAGTLGGDVERYAQVPLDRT